MIVRKIKAEELKRTIEMFAIAFEFGRDNDKSAEEVYEEISKHPQSREETFWGERWAAFEDDNQTMMSCFIAQPFPMHFDGNVYTMTGIGGVASLPQYRKNGAIRACFEKALPVMYEDGAAFSYLYPFSTVFYRKFGYELGCEKMQYHIRLQSLKYFEVSGNCTLVEPGNYMLSEIKQIYSCWQNKYNMMVANENCEFAWVEKSNPVQEQVFTYVYQSADKIPMGYLTIRQIKESDGRNLWCDRFFFTCAEGFKGLLNLLVALGSDHDYVTLELPSDVDMALLLPEWSKGAVVCRKYHGGMVRVINVEKILAGARYRGSGRIAIKIIDEQIEQNNTVFIVNYESGRSVNVIRRVDEEPDICMEINEFSRLIIGACDTDSLQYMDNVTLYNNKENIGQVFYKKPNYIVENF